MLGKIESRRRSGQQRMRWLDGITNPIDMSVRKPQEIVKDRKAWNASVHGVHGLQPTRLLSPWDFPGKSTGVGCHCLLRVKVLLICK